MDKPFSRDSLFGRGIGDADYHIAEVFPLIAAPSRDELVASSHNFLLELLVINGLASLPLLVWALISIFKAARLDHPGGAIAIAVGTVSFANVPRLANVIRQAASGGGLSYRLEGTIGVDAGRFGQPMFGPLTIVSGDLRARF